MAVSTSLIIIIVLAAVACLCVFATACLALHLFRIRKARRFNSLDADESGSSFQSLVAHERHYHMKPTTIRDSFLGDDYTETQRQVDLLHSSVKRLGPTRATVEKTPPRQDATQPLMPSQNSTSVETSGWQDTDISFAPEVHSTPRRAPASSGAPNLPASAQRNLALELQEMNAPPASRSSQVSFASPVRPGKRDTPGDRPVPKIVVEHAHDDEDDIKATETSPAHDGTDAIVSVRVVAADKQSLHRTAPRFVVIRGPLGSSGLGIILTGNSPVVVQHVDHGSPAARAGILKGDTILEVDGHSCVMKTHAEVIRRFAQAVTRSTRKAAGQRVNVAHASSPAPVRAGTASSPSMVRGQHGIAVAPVSAQKHPDFPEITFALPGQMRHSPVNKASEEVAPVTPRYQSIRALATSHQVEASRLMGLGQFKEAGDLLDKAISLLNTVPEKHRTAALGDVVIEIQTQEPAAEPPMSISSSRRASKQVSEPIIRQPSKPLKPNPNIVTPLRASKVIPVKITPSQIAPAAAPETEVQPRRNSFGGTAVKEFARRNSFGPYDTSTPPRTISANRKENIGFKAIEAALDMGTTSPSKEVEVVHPTPTVPKFVPDLSNMRSQSTSSSELQRSFNSVFAPISSLGKQKSASPPSVSSEIDDTPPIWL